MRGRPPAACTRTLAAAASREAPLSSRLARRLRDRPPRDTLGATTLGIYSDINKAAGYKLQTCNIAGFAGRTVALKFNGVEDSSLQTSFVIDDTAVTLG